MGSKRRKKRLDRAERRRRARRRVAPPAEIDLDSLIPSRFLSERLFRRFRSVAGDREFESHEELERAFASVVEESNAGTMPGAGPQELAQDLAYVALDAEDPNLAVGLAARAWLLDPNCVDAIATLAVYTAETAEEATTFLGRAVEVGEQVLGEEFFREQTGHFWGLVETRPYMRALESLASALWSSGRRGEAIQRYSSMLELNPNDNQGIRYPLLGCALEAADLGTAQRVLDAYSLDNDAGTLWARVLERFLSGDRDGARAALARARAQNPHVEAYLSGEKPMPPTMPDHYSPGDEGEALNCAGCLREAYRTNPEAKRWMTETPQS